MNRLIVFWILAGLTGCAPFQAQIDEQVHVVVIEKPVTLQLSDTIRVTPSFQHPVVPGNFAFFPNTRTPQNETLQVLVLGNPLPNGFHIPVRVLGVHEQVSNDGLLSTVIATTLIGKNLQSVEEEKSGSLAVIEAGLTGRNGSKARSLGFRAPKVAGQRIDQAKDDFIL